MSETKWQHHPKNPANQPFVGRGSPCKSKVKSWWNSASQSNNGKQK